MPPRRPGTPVHRISVDHAKVDAQRWPFTLPVVRHLTEKGLELEPGATVLLGANGSGKSTIVEAIAAAWARRITGVRNDWLQQAAARPSPEDSRLHEALRLECTPGGGYGGLFFRAERLHAQSDSFGGRGRWQERLGPVPLLQQSHGEGFLQVLAGMTAEAGLYILDEPESALSFDSCLVLLHLMADMLAAGSQIVLATHSPVLAALPGATLLQLDRDGFSETTYDSSDLVVTWRSFLTNPTGYLRHLATPQ
jgi:predicted ATPase